MYEEESKDLPDWEDPPEEKIPPALRKKWHDDEKKGIRAGVCASCRYPYTEDQLTCAHCGRPFDATAGAVSSLANWLFKTPWGIVTFLIILIAVISLLVGAF